MKFKGIIIGVVAAVLLTGFLTYVTWLAPTNPSLAGQFSITTSSEVFNYGKAFLGSHIGTTTIGVDKNGGATTSYPISIGRNVSTAVINFKVTAATSTASLAVAVLGSNDFNCTTNVGSGEAATNTITTNINWFGISDHLKGRVHSTSLLSSSTPLHWVNPSVNSGSEIILTDLNYECLRVDVSGLSTTVYGEITTKN